MLSKIAYGRTKATLNFPQKKDGVQARYSPNFNGMMRTPQCLEMFMSRFFNNEISHSKINVMVTTSRDFVGKKAIVHFGELLYFIAKAHQICPHIVVPAVIHQKALTDAREKRIIIATQTIKLYDKNDMFKDFLFCLVKCGDDTFRLEAVPATYDTPVYEDYHFLVLA